MQVFLFALSFDASKRCSLRLRMPKPDIPVSTPPAFDFHLLGSAT